MKNLSVLIVALILASCGTSRRLEKMDLATAKIKERKVYLPTANPTQIAIDVQYLSSDELNGRETGTKGIEMAADYLKERLQTIGIEPYGSGYFDAFSSGDLKGYNVVGMLPGSDRELMKETIVIGAHYDHIGIISAVDGDSIANGANDNATGTATVLAIADAFKKLDFNRRKVVFALFSAEEKGLIGSRKLAEKMKANGENVVAMINFEMTGTPMVDKEYITYLTGYDTSNMGEIFNREYEKFKVTEKLEAAAKMNLFRRSDNYSFYEVFKIPAQTFCTFDFTNFDHYHQVGDDISQVSARHMADVVNAVMPGLFEIINDEVPVLTAAIDE
ncbi:M20/M25/M40 family metallo-hydrolase [Nonlabens ponticola]|uniref:M20/M25/M40 family metallo-hydrolase n=1 Tax=Nonlabens ponticola TaxID=2496866 RepID=A0A3S9MWR9_9FLAO|nr:M20/M25/M40 family metallo-hydrolase [Nonlabens ponticola]AZQ43630.1 M20/M25/M40 family metallo-hydrolase [Nonlabens ponticola]